MTGKTPLKNTYKALAIIAAVAITAAIFWILYAEGLWGIHYEYADLAALDAIKHEERRT